MPLPYAAPFTCNLVPEALRRPVRMIACQFSIDEPWNAKNEPATDQDTRAISNRLDLEWQTSAHATASELARTVLALELVKARLLVG